VQHLGATRKQVRRIMHRAGLKALYPGKNLSKPKQGAKKYPYLGAPEKPIKYCSI